MGVLPYNQECIILLPNKLILRTRYEPATSRIQDTDKMATDIGALSFIGEKLISIDTWAGARPSCFQTPWVSTPWLPTPWVSTPRV